MDESTTPVPEQSQSPLVRYARSVLIYGVLLIAFGVFLPWRKGLDFFDPALLSAYACLGIVFAGPAAAQAFDRRPESMKEAVARIALASGFGEAIAIAMLACGLLTVRLTLPYLLFGPDLALLSGSVLLGLTTSFALSALAAWIALQYSSGAARLALRIVLLVLVVAFFLQSRLLPQVAVTGAIIAAIAAAVFLFLIRASLRRA
ncbi:MAG: hypothetical protein JO307_32320 [Bryobacterales bacterium]|nr:hypothetical protein [Bryobacterales bacterium]MBV9400329.1 hypothetical protein [Bryobacterales bacterium]